MEEQVDQALATKVRDKVAAGKMRSLLGLEMAMATAMESVSQEIVAKVKQVAKAIIKLKLVATAIRKMRNVVLELPIQIALIVRPMTAVE